MGNLDTSKLPAGNRARAALIASLEEGDDRVERHYLELKSRFDLNDKSDRRKVVKFILGASHRDPAKAARHFDGHALMVLGLSLDGVAGLAKFELLDLERDIATFVGSDPPGWDVDLIPAGDGRDYVVIIVDPPDSKIRPVLKDGEPLRDGDIYIRVDGATRRAVGPEIVSMLSRAHAQTHEQVLDVDVRPAGVLHSRIIDVEALREFVDWHRDRLEAQVETVSSRSLFAALAPVNLDRRSRDEFLHDVQEWRDASFNEPETGLNELASQMTNPFILHIVNNARVSLKEVRLEVTFDAPVTALYWEEPESVVELFSDRPADWGRDSFLSTIPLGRWEPPAVPNSFDGAIRIETERPAKLVVELRRLHPEQIISTPDEDLVLVLYSDGPGDVPAKVTARWRLSAGDVHDVRRGEFELELETRDWREPLSSIIFHARNHQANDQDVGELG